LKTYSGYCQRVMFGDQPLELFSETWPQQGMMRSGRAYRQQPLVRDTYEIASGLWPTPTARDWKDGCSTQNVPENCLLGRVVKPNKESGPLNAEFSGWLMGFPAEWTALDA
jgi:hypothetical protein